MYSLRTAPRPFTPSDLLHLPSDERPVFYLRPPLSGDMLDARSEATIAETEDTYQDAYCTECGAEIKVKVRMSLPGGRVDGGKMTTGTLARVIDRVDHMAFDGVAAPWPEPIVDRVAYVRRLPLHWLNEMAEAAKADSDLDPEEEREDSDSEQS